MAKKNEPASLVDLIQQMMSDMTEEEQQAAFDAIACYSTHVNENLSQQYTHQCPDYNQMIQPIAPYLMPLWEMEELDDYLPEQLYEVCDNIPKKELERDLRNFVFNLFAKYGHSPDDNCDYLLWYVFSVMERYRLEHCLDIVLEVLRQDAPFIGYCFGLMPANLLAAIVYQLGQRQLPVLMEFMKEPGLLPIAKYRVVEAVTHIVITTPARRVEVMVWFGKLLNYYFEVLKNKNNDICPPILIDHIAACMMDTRGVENIPILEKIYNTYHFSPDGIPGIQELKEKMPYAEMCGLEIDSVAMALDDYLNDYFIEIAKGDDDEDEAEEDPLYLLHLPAKKMRVKIELEGTRLPIWRTVELPSNICLERFAGVVNDAMGWHGCHLHQFITKDLCYLPSDYEEDGFFPKEGETWDSSVVSLGEVLCEKGSTMKYEYDFGDNWMHRITVESLQDYEPGEEQSIVLLDGANACPPDDCGGIRGYEKMLEALKKPRSKQAREYKNWLGYVFDPLEFDKEDTRFRLASIEE